MNLMLHCNAKDTTWENLCNVVTPEPTETHHPVPHHVLFGMVRDQMAEQGYRVTESQHGITKDGDRYFGVMQLQSDHLKDWAPVVGLRNSHDKSITAGMCFGTSVFVCDNMAFYGDLFSLSRMHTSKILEDLPEKIKEGCGKSGQTNKRMELTIDHYKATKVSNRLAHHLIVKALDNGAIVSRSLPHVLEEWRNPRHIDFKSRNAWSLFNAFTETMKRAGDIGTHIGRTSRLHRVFDKQLGVEKALEKEITLAI